MSNYFNHPFHLVTYSPWPFTGSLSIFILVLGITNWFHKFNINFMLLGYLIILLTMYQWWRDISRESTFQGYHTLYVSKGMKWGMILFILSEILFFFSFFWTFFHSSLSPSIEIGMMWPPLSIMTFNPFQIPLLNTIILLSSGITVTWAHHCLVNNNYLKMIQTLFFTIILGIYFTILQAYEYYEASFTIADSIYGATFFITTGFHGLHVIIGTLFLIMCLMRQIKYHFSKYHHFGFEAAIWYWHFVDVVWLFLFISIYWWGK